MEKNHNKLRIMVIDIKEDKLILDEFCDSIVAGLSRFDADSGIAQKKLGALKGDLASAIAAITGAEGAADQAKRELVNKVMEQYRGGDIDEYLEKLLKGELNENP